MPRLSGGKKTKTSSVTVRVSSRAKYGMELVGRLYGESLSDVVNRALKGLFENENRSVLAMIDGKTTDLLRETYSEDEWERFLKLAVLYPDALSDDEKRIWTRIKGNEAYWQKTGRKRVLDLDRAKTDEEILRQG